MRMVVESVLCNIMTFVTPHFKRPTCKGFFSVIIAVATFSSDTSMVTLYIVGEIFFCFVQFI